MSQYSQHLWLVTFIFTEFIYLYLNIIFRIVGIIPVINHYQSNSYEIDVDFFLAKGLNEKTIFINLSLGYRHKVIMYTRLLLN